MLTQAEKADRFAELHKRPGTFVIPNPWDVGSAILLERLGFEALATSSSGYAFSIGKADHEVGRDVMLKHAAEVAAATNIPLSIDLENGFGDSPEFVAETIRRAAATGAAGGSIEDSTENGNEPIYDRGFAVDRVRAAAEAAHSLPFTFTLTARAENYLKGRRDLKDTIERLQMYQEAGADVLFAPGITSKEEIATLVASVDRPVNVILGMTGIELTLADMSEVGVKRISLGSSLARSALGAFLRAAREIREHGTFGFAADAAPGAEINAIFKQRQ